MTGVRKKRYSGVGERTSFSPLSVVMLVLLAVYTLVMFFLLIWGFLQSFNDPETVNYFTGKSYALPEKWTFNYTGVFDRVKISIETAGGQRDVLLPEMFFNSLLYSLGCAFTNTFVSCIMAYMCAKYKNKVSSIIYGIVIVTMVIPIVGNLPSEMKMARTFNLHDKIWGLWIMRANFLGMYFLIFYAAFQGLPDAYNEAAKIDGASNFTILFRINMPLVRNLFMTILLVVFINFWNDYQTPLLYMPSYPTAALGLYQFKLLPTSTIPDVMTAAMMILIPVLILFLIFHKKLLGNLTIGGIKG